MRIHTLALAAGMAVLAHGATAQDSDEVRFMTQLLNQVNALSFKNNREYCGYVGYDADGNFVATPAKKGREDSCLPEDPPQNLDIFASFHSHGAFSPNAYSEWPSSNDIEGDEQEGIDGYVATPGGRMWYIDSQDLVTSQLCGIACLTQDPAFRAGLDGEISQSYTLDEIRRKEAED